MDSKDLLKLRGKIHADFKKWFSYNRKHNCLYCNWLPTQSEELDLSNFVGSDFVVIVSLPCSTFILPVYKK